MVAVAGKDWIRRRITAIYVCWDRMRCTPTQPCHDILLSRQAKRADCRIPRKLSRQPHSTRPFAVNRTGSTLSRLGQGLCTQYIDPVPVCCPLPVLVATAGRPPRRPLSRIVVCTQRTHKPAREPASQPASSQTDNPRRLLCRCACRGLSLPRGGAHTDFVGDWWRATENMSFYTQVHPEKHRNTFPSLSVVFSPFVETVPLHLLIFPDTQASPLIAVKP